MGASPAAALETIARYNHAGDGRAPEAPAVIPERPQARSRASSTRYGREPGIHTGRDFLRNWIPGSPA